MTRTELLAEPDVDAAPASRHARRRSSPPTALRTSVVMTTFNRRHLLERHLPTLLSDPAATEVIVVNDGSTDGTAAWLAGLAARHPQLIAVSTGNGGPDHARRIGVEHATGDLLVLMDDDVEPTESTIGDHVRHHCQRSDLVVVGYMPVGEDTPGRENVATAIYSLDYERVMSRYDEDPGRILFDLWNGHVSLRRDAYLQACDRDEPWPRHAFYEDRNVGLRLHRLGLIGRFDRQLLARHRHHGDLRNFRRTARSMGYGDRLLHERHPDLLGPYDPTAWVDDLVAPLRLLVRLGDLPGAPAITALLEQAARAADRMGWQHPADRIARLMRRMELRIGARQRERETREEPRHAR